MSAHDGDALDSDVAIETPEHIVFHYRVAGPARRALAHVLDLLVCYGGVAFLAVVVFIAFLGGKVDAGEVKGAAKAGIGIILLALFFAQWLYFLLFEALSGRSPGKAAVGLRVVTTSGRRIGWSAAALRNLLRAADLLPVGYVVGVVAAALSPRFQRIGDLVAGTMVVVPESVGRAGAVGLDPPAAPREVATLPDEVVLDAEERVAIELFLRRRATLGIARERELASMIADAIGERIGFTHPDPARLLALVYDRAVNAGRTDAPPSLRPPPRRAP